MFGKGEKDSTIHVYRLLGDSIFSQHEHFVIIKIGSLEHLEYFILCILAKFNLTLSQTTNFRLFKTERVSIRFFKSDENGKMFSKWVENTVGKAEIVCYEQFLLFPHCFQRLVLLTHKNQGLFGKGLTAAAYRKSQCSLKVVI